MSSLSKKMRNESKGSNKSLSVSASLDHIRLPTLKPKFSTGPTMPISPRHPKNAFERLSGLYDMEASVGVFADRETIIHPSVLCVRCSNNAAVCMGCTEELCNNAVKFFKTTRALGAAHLISNAVKEAGATITLKSLTFKLWKNSFAMRRRSELKMKNIVEKMFGVSCVFTPFKAWQKYTKENLMKRKEAIISTLNTKVGQLEQQIRKIEAEKKDIQMAAVSAKAASAATAASHTNVYLHEALATERSRVVFLAGLIEHLLTSVKQVQQLLHTNACALRADILQASTILPSHDISHAFTGQDRENILNIYNQRRDRGYSHGNEFGVEISVENAIILNMMLEWINSTSVRCSRKVESSTRQCVDHFLPPYEKTTAFTQLLSGKQLARVVVCLIFDSNEGTNTLGPARGTTTPAESLLDEEALLEFDRFQGNPLFLTSCLMNYSVKYLNVPVFRVHDVRADMETLRSFVSHLMLASNPTSSEKDLSSLDEYSKQYERISSGIEVTNIAVSNLEAVINANKKYGNLLNNTSEELANFGGSRSPEVMSPIKLPSDLAEELAQFAAAVSQPNSAAPSRRNSFVSFPPSTIAKSGVPHRAVSIATAAGAAIGAARSSGGTPPASPRMAASRFLVPIPAKAPTGEKLSRVEQDLKDNRLKALYPDKTHGRMYEVFGTALDELRESSDKDVLHESMEKMSAHVSDICDLRMSVDKARYAKEVGMRLTTDVKNFVQAMNSEVLLRRLNWLGESISNNGPQARDTSNETKQPHAFTERVPHR